MGINTWPFAASIPAAIAFQREGDTLLAVRPSDSGEHRSLHGLTRTLVANMVIGVTQGFERRLEIHGVGYRCTARPGRRATSSSPMGLR